MQVVGKQPPVPQSSAWATPLSFSDPDAAPPQHQPMPSLQPPLSAAHHRQPVPHPAAPPLSTNLSPPPPPPPPPPAMPTAPSVPTAQSAVAAQQPQLQPQSELQRQMLASRTTFNPDADLTYALVRSESAPLNLFEDLPSNLAALSVEDPSPFPTATLSGMRSNKPPHPSALHSTSPNSTLNPPSRSASPPAPRPGNLASSHLPPRSLSSVELAGIANPSRAASRAAMPSASPSVPKGSRKASAQPWGKSVFDMIQDDFPRTPSPMFSSLLAARNAGAAATAAGSTTASIDPALAAHPTTSRGAHPPTHPNLHSNHSAAHATLHARAHPAIDRRARLASTASLDLDLEALRAAERAGDIPPSRGLLREDILPHGPNAASAESQTSRAHHRRSVSVNWADLRTLTAELSRNQSHSTNASSPTTALFGSLDGAPVPNGPTSRTPSDGVADGPASQSSSPPGSKPRSTLSGSSPLAPPAAQPAVPKAAAHRTAQQYSPMQPDHLVENQLDDLVAPSLTDYDYLYEQNEPSLPPTSPLSSALGGGNNVNASAHIAPFPSQPYAGSAQSIASQQAQTAQHIGNAAASLVSSHNQQMGTGAAQYGNVFPGMGLFPSPFSNNTAAVPPANAMAPMYTDSFRDNMAAADSLKNMSIQMAAFITAQQQLYAAQMAQMAAMTGNSGFGTNPASFTGGLPAAAAAAAAATMSQAGGSGNGHLRSPWDSRENGPSNHRNAPRGGNKHHFDQYRGGFSGVGGAPKKLNSMEAHPGHKGRSTRGRRGHRTHDEVGVISGHKASDRIGMSGMGISSGIQDPGHARSPLLEEFRATSLSIGRGIGSVSELGVGGGYSAGSVSQVHNGREWQLSEISNHVVEFATDQHGSRFIQQKLESASPEDKEAVLKHALTDAQRLMTDVFGNYVVQKLLDHGGEKAVKAIAQELEGRMLALSLHMYGCRVVQKALEVLEPNYRAGLVRELDGHVLKCIRDQNGNHVIQKCVELVEPDSVQFIVDSVQGQAVALAGHSYGCRVVQRILEHGAGSQKAPIMVEIMSCIAELIKDQYGNYVIQHVVEHGTEKERGEIMNLVRGELCQLSQHKFASNVVERCLQFGSLEERQVLIEILIVGEGQNCPSPLNHLVRDQFGNYVVQRVLDVALPPQRERVVTILRAQVPAIKKYSYGKHIIARLEEHQGSPGVTAGFNHGHSSHGHGGHRGMQRGERQAGAPMMAGAVGHGIGQSSHDFLCYE